MRETRTYGSARGAAGNSRPYRKPGPEPEATLAAGGVRCLGWTCRRGVGPNPPLVTQLRHAARKHDAAQRWAP